MPATELTVATRILAHLEALAPGGRVALRVGSEVAYLCSAAASPLTMTPYDVAALRIADVLVLAGALPDDAARYAAALWDDRSAAAAAAGRDGGIVAAPGLAALVERLTGLEWETASSRVRARGGLVGAYPAGSES